MFRWFGQLCSVLQILRGAVLGSFLGIWETFQMKGDVARPTGTRSGQVGQFQSSSCALVSLLQGLLAIVLPSAGKLLRQTCNRA